LLSVLHEKGASHGYELASEINRQRLTDSVVDPAAVYRLLHVLEVNGFVISEWDTAAPGPARRRYSLTPKGEALLSEWVSFLRRHRNDLDAFLKRHDKEKKGEEKYEDRDNHREG